MVAGDVSEAHRVRLQGETPASGINAVVVPSQLGLHMTEKLHDILGVDWIVYRLGYHKQPYEQSNTKRRIKIGSQEVPWSETDANAPPRERRVLVITYEQMSLLSNLAMREAFLGDDLLSTNSDDPWQNLFRRMIHDEGHSLRRFDETRRGLNARRSAPKYRHVVTGTPIIRTARDFRGYIALVERPDWVRPEIDRNEERDANGDLIADGRYNRYRAEVNRCKLADRLPDETQFVDDDNDWQLSVRGRTHGCDDDGVARGRLLNIGAVTDWPATLFYNSHHRRRSVPRNEHHLRTRPIVYLKGLTAAESAAAKQSHEDEKKEEATFRLVETVPLTRTAPSTRTRFDALQSRRSTSESSRTSADGRSTKT